MSEFDTTATLAPPVPTAPISDPTLQCPHCRRSDFGTKSGLTLHIKVCKKADEAQVVPVQPQLAARSVPPTQSYGRPNGSANHDHSPKHDQDPRSFDGYKPNHDRDVDPRVKPVAAKDDDKRTPFSMNDKAFIMYPDHVAMMLDINFCIALADHILKNGSENKAITAFGHQLRRLDGD